MQCVVYYDEQDEPLITFGIVNSYADYLVLNKKIHNLQRFEDSLDWDKLIDQTYPIDKEHVNQDYLHYYESIVRRELHGYEDFADEYMQFFKEYYGISFQHIWVEGLPDISIMDDTTPECEESNTVDLKDLPAEAQELIDEYLNNVKETYRI